MNKKIALIILLFFLNVSFSQFLAPLSPSKIVLKSGDTISGIVGKLSGKKFKYKNNEKGKAKKILFSEISSLEIKYPYGQQKFYFFKTTLDNSYKPYFASSTGGKVELFFQTKTYNRRMAGGMSFKTTVTHYYIRRKNEEKLFPLGPYSPLTNNLREKVIRYFSDCKTLTEKIKNREFKVREGLYKIVNFYNENCN